MKHSLSKRIAAWIALRSKRHELRATRRFILDLEDQERSARHALVRWRARKTMLENEIKLLQKPRDLLPIRSIMEGV